MILNRTKLTLLRARKPRLKLRSKSMRKELVKISNSSLRLKLSIRSIRTLMIRFRLSLKILRKPSFQGRMTSIRLSKSLGS